MTKKTTQAATNDKAKTGEVVKAGESDKQSTAVAAVESAQGGVAAAFASFRIAKRVTLPTINPGVNQPVVFRIMDGMRVSTYAAIKPDGTKEKPATVCTVTDMQTGQIALWLVAEVCAKNLQEQYPDEGYVGKIFGVQKLPKRPGKRYFDFEIAELEVDDSAE